MAREGAIPRLTSAKKISSDGADQAVNDKWGAAADFQSTGRAEDQTSRTTCGGKLRKAKQITRALPMAG